MSGSKSRPFTTNDFQFSLISLRFLARFSGVLLCNSASDAQQRRSLGQLIFLRVGRAGLCRLVDRFQSG